MRVVSSGWSFTRVVYYEGGVIRVVSSEGALAFMGVVSRGWSLKTLVFHGGGLMTVVFYEGGISRKGGLS